VSNMGSSVKGETRRLGDLRAGGGLGFGAESYSYGLLTMIVSLEQSSYRPS
jgi:hypothetical protein